MGIQSNNNDISFESIRFVTVLFVCMAHELLVSEISVFVMLSCQ